MRIGEYLIERGIVTETDVLDALTLQFREQLPIGKIALQQGLMTVSQVMKIVDLQAHRNDYETQAAAELFGTLALSFGFISEEDLKQILIFQRTTRKPLGEALVQLGAMTENQLIEVLADYERLLADS